MIEIDGSYLEAGGQIIRTAVGLSALTGKACKISNIRSGRPNPGLQRQHLSGLRAVAMLCNAKVTGDTLGSMEVCFEPADIHSRPFSIDVESAGSIALVLQSLIIPAIATQDKLIFDIKGGTDVNWSPSANYFRDVLSYWLEKMGIKVRTEIIRHGFYPAGGGHVKVEIEHAKIVQPLVLTKRGEPRKMHVESIASETLRPARVAERQLGSAQNALGILQNFPMDTQTNYVSTLSPGSSFQLFAEFSNCRLGSGVVGERDKPAEKVGEEAATLLKSQIDSNACIDRWSADQLLPFLAIAAEKKPSEISVAEITNHCLTNIWVIEKFLPVKFEIRGNKGEPGTIGCRKI